MVVYSSDGKTYSSHEEARAAAGISSGTKKSSSSTTQSSQPKQSGNSVTQTSAPTSSNSTTTKSSSSSSQPITNITVQPVYVSGGSGGNTYRIVDENGNSHQISSSGQSLSDLSLIHI